MLKIMLALILLAHGIGHSLGLLQVFRITTVNPEWHGDSWLLTAPLGTGIAQAIGVVCWTAAIVGFAAAAAVVVGWLPASWWAPLALGSALASIAGLALFPVAFPPVSSVAALGVDLAVLAAVLVVHWTPEQLAP
jgi:hypothetical protein